MVINFFALLCFSTPPFQVLAGAMLCVCIIAFPIKIIQVPPARPAIIRASSKASKSIKYAWRESEKFALISHLSHRLICVYTLIILEFVCLCAYCYIMLHYHHQHNHNHLVRCFAHIFYLIHTRHLHRYY